MTTTKCTYCSKNFRNAVVRDKHEYEQICVPIQKKTYCKVCDLRYNTIPEFQQHMISRDHLKRVAHMDVDVVNVELIEDECRAKLKTLLSADPILAECDPPAEDVKIFFNDGSIAKVEVNGADLRDMSLTQEDRIIQGHVSQGQMSYQDLVEQARGSARLTPRQDKIMDYLAKWEGYSPMEMVAKFRIILEKIGLDDADYLGTHIRSCPKLSLEARQIYGAYLDEFIRQLTGLVIKGEKTYREMDLFAFVARLTK